MWKRLTGLIAASVLVLSGCVGVTTAPRGTVAKISVVAQSTPSTSASIQSFQLQVASAVLNPGNVQLVTAPVALDLAQIAAGSAFLSSVSAPEGIFSSMVVTFASPSITITTTTGNALAIPGGSCAAQSTCSFVPAMKNSQSTITTGVFPLTVSSDKRANFALMMDEGKILQADDSLDFNSGVDGETDQLASGSGTDGGNEPLEAELGVVRSFSAGQMVLVDESNEASPAILTDARTIYNYPAPICAANNAACVAAGQIVTAALSLTTAGAVHADSISYADAANATLVEGIVGAVASGGNTFQVQVVKAFGLASGVSGAPMDESELAVTIQSGTLFGISSVGYPAAPGATFNGPSSLMAGQMVLVDVGSGSQLPNVSTSQIFLTDSIASGTISALAGNLTFLLTDQPSGLEDSSGINSQVMVQSGGSTQYRNPTLVGFSSLADGQSVSAEGPLFNVSSAPTIAATEISVDSPTDQ